MVRCWSILIWKTFGRKRSWPNLRDIPAFAWWDWGKPWNPSGWPVFQLRVELSTTDTNVECYHYAVCLLPALCWRRHVLRNVGWLSTDCTALYPRDRTLHTLNHRCENLKCYFCNLFTVAHSCSVYHWSCMLYLAWTIEQWVNPISESNSSLLSHCNQVGYYDCKETRTIVRFIPGLGENMALCV
jgi:hypothetical protein